MRVFVTGGTGFVGSHLVKELLGAGHELTVLARDPSSLPNGVSSIRGDLEHRESYEADLVGHEALIHNALVWPEEDNSELEMRDIRASAHLFHAAAEAGIEHLIYTSSVAVHRPFQGVMIEDSPTKSSDFYGVTKIAGEAFLNAVGQMFGVRTTVLRPGPVVGAPAFEGGPHKSDRRFGEFIRAARAGQPLCVPRDESRQFIGAQALAQAFRQLLEGKVAGTFLVVDRQPFSWREIALEILSKIGSKSPLLTIQAPDPISSFDPRRVEAILGKELSSRAELSAHIDHFLRT